MQAQEPILIKDGMIIKSLTRCDGTLYFSGKNIDQSSQLYRTNESNDETFIVKEIKANESRREVGDPTDLIAVNNLLFFNQYDGNGDYKKLWVTDGTESGTKIVKNSTLTFGLANGIAFKNQLFFVDYLCGLWHSDGTEEGTKLLKHFDLFGVSFKGPNFMIMDNSLFFFATDSAHGTELWKTDGTADGTVLVKDINIGSASSSDYGNSSTVNNGYLYFSANDGIHGSEPWRTDGSDEGTVMLKDINPGSQSSTPKDFIVNKGVVYFSAADTSYLANYYNSPYSVNNTELYRTDGTENGTYMVKDINKSKLFGSRVDNLMTCNNQLLFLASNSDVVSPFPSFFPVDLYTSDGSSKGTHLFREVCNDICFPGTFVKSKYEIYFFANDSSKRWLCKTNGYANGTMKMIDLSGEQFYQSPSGMIVVGSNLYFTTYTGNNFISKLWKLKISEEAPANLDSLSSVFPNFLKIFPNPFSNEIELKFTKTPNSSVKINLYDGIGKRIFQGEFSPDQYLIMNELDKFPLGIYLLEVSYDDQKIIKKLIKSK
ncbi:ELWxxDGT repeat protein [Aurantibacillus circumpalustris]|uniref:ELWxxDGT repeat protein n=1 Tax=Aurantibacillus circumpalustris TaxID=3036359 RepID=UPI00295A7E51|nr:ELWxxDGT repeat protein [Aurantibacillus circumpalustris]